MDLFWQELRFALRTLRKSPVFTLVSTLSLGSSIAVVVMMLGIIEAADFQALPFANAAQLVALSRRDPPGTECAGCRHPLAVDLFLEWRQRARMFAEFEGSAWRRRELRDGNDRQSLDVRAATTRFLPMLGATPVIGRGFLAGDTIAGAPPVALLSHALWRARFGGDTGIVGKAIQLGDPNQRPIIVPVPYTVIGVLPAGFTFDGRAQAWTVLDLRSESMVAAKRRSIEPIARLRPGTSVPAADADLRRIDRDIETGRNAGPREIATVEPLKGAWTDEHKVAQERFTFLGIAGIVVLLAALNVAGLAVARAFQRRVEFTIRRALGAPPMRVFRQLAVEMTVVAAIAGCLAVFATKTLARALSEHFLLDAIGLSVTISYRLLAMVLLLVMLVGVGTGMLAFRQVGRSDLGANLRAAGTIGATRRRNRLRYALIAGEMALALVVLVGAGLLGKELSRIVTTEIGFDPRNAVTISVFRPGATAGAADPDQVRVRSRAAVERYANVRGVVLASAWSADMQGVTRVQPAGREIGEREPLITQDVWSNYFKTMGLPVVRGRSFSAEDGSGTEPVAIVNRRLADRLWPGAEPLGQRLLFSNDGAEETATVVGVVGNFEVDGYTPALHMLIAYRPMAQGRPNGVRAFLRLQASDSSTLGLVRLATAELRGDAVGIDEIVPLQRSVDAGLSSPRFNAGALAALAAFSLFLAVIGIYGVVTATVIEHTREIGLRVALGADRRAVLWHVLRPALIVTALGAAAGLAGALAGTRLLNAMLFGTSATDPFVFVGAAAVLSLAVLVATFIPAKRAAALDPVIALRAE